MWIRTVCLLVHTASGIRDLVRRGAGYRVRLSHRSPSYSAVDVQAPNQEVRSIILFGVDSTSGSRLRDIETAYTDLGVFTTALIQARREELATEQTRYDQKKDVFRLLLRANESEEKLGLTDSELVGDILTRIFLPL
jgi:hypothetical protein